MGVTREFFISTKDFLKSSRNIGIGVEEGVYEIIDNALDAEAQNIWINIEKKENGNFQFIFIDDGIGIPNKVPGKDNEEREGIPYVLTYGGRIPHPNQTKPIGKFGFGLSQTASCLSSRTEVYSKTRDDKNWRYAYYDFNELMENDCLLFPEIDKQPPWLTLPETGTIVVMKEVDNADYSQANAVVTMLVKNLGRVYRHYLDYDTSITISHGKHGEKRVSVSDPFAEIPESLEHQTLGGESLDYGQVEIIFDKNNPLGEIIDRRTDEPAKCILEFRRFSVEKVRSSLGLPLTGSLGVPQKKTMNKWGFNDRGQGFSVLRNGRELKTGQALSIYTKSPNLNFFRAHVAFSDALDDIFNVKTNKSRFSINPILRNLIKEKSEKIISSIRKDIQEEIKNLNQTIISHRIPVAETIASEVNHMLNRPIISDEEREKGNQEVKQKIEQIIQLSKNENLKQINEAEAVLEKAKSSRSKPEIRTAEINLKTVKEQAEKSIEAIEKRFGFESNCRKFVDIVGTGGLFEIKAHGDHAWVTVNSATEFYSRVYSLAEKDPDLEGLLDLMIFSIAWSEHTDDFDKKPDWEHIRREISTQAEIFVNSMSSLVEGGEA